MVMGMKIRVENQDHFPFCPYIAKYLSLSVCQLFIYIISNGGIIPTPSPLSSCNSLRDIHSIHPLCPVFCAQKPINLYLYVKATFLFQTVFLKADDVPRHPERRWNVLACGCVSREHRMLLDHLDHLAELRSSFSRIGLNCLDKDPPGLDRPRQV